MFPGQQCATCPAQIWPPRLGIKLLEGAPSTEKFRKVPIFGSHHKKEVVSAYILHSRC